MGTSPAPLYRSIARVILHSTLIKTSLTPHTHTHHTLVTPLLCPSPDPIITTHNCTPSPILEPKGPIADSERHRQRPIALTFMSERPNRSPYSHFPEH